MFLMKPLMRISESGSWKTVSAMTRLHSELVSDSVRKISNSGMIIRAPGMNCVQSIPTMNAALPRKL